MTDRLSTICDGRFWIESKVSMVCWRAWFIDFELVLSCGRAVLKVFKRVMGGTSEPGERNIVI